MYKHLGCYVVVMFEGETDVTLRDLGGVALEKIAYARFPAPCILFLFFFFKRGEGERFMYSLAPHAGQRTRGPFEFETRFPVIPAKR